jgi:hypothetical protein
MVSFVGVLFVIVGGFNLLDGLIALVDSNYFSDEGLLFGDLATWGVWFLLIGAAQVVAGWQILSRRELGVYLALGLVGLSMLTQFVFLGAYPAWSIAILVLDLVIVYGLCSNWLEFETTDTRLGR